jgi:hypothetical protein
MDDQAPLVLDIMEDCKCLWNKKKSEHCRNTTARENALQSIVQELNFPELIVEEIKLKSKQLKLNMLLG